MALHVIDDIARLGRTINQQCKLIALHDGELASQVRRAWVRAGMNAGEAQHRRGAKASNRFDDAMGEAREAYTGLRLAVAFEYLDPEPIAALFDEVDRVVAILFKLANRTASRRQ